MGNPRVDQTGRAHRGSQRQVQTWVNEHAAELNQGSSRRCPSSLPPTQITWRSPLRADEYREYADAAFLTRIGRPDLVAELARFWPSGGPVWDGLTTSQSAAGAKGVILVEGKSYPAEIEGPGCQAGKAGSEASRQSRIKIASALRQTQTWLEMADIP